MTRAALDAFAEEVVECVRCPRLVRYRERIAEKKVRRFSGETYWGRPVPGFGDPKARLVIVGLAPAAHGANRTGRMFTGDRSGDWLYRALHRAGFANQPESLSSNDGLRLRDAWVTACVRCAPPDNKPSPAERDRCLDYLVRELELLKRARVFLALGGFALDGLRRTLDACGDPVPRGARFGHAKRFDLASGRVVVTSYHPSQQNTFTGRLTEAMLDAVFAEVRGQVSTINQQS